MSETPKKNNDNSDGSVLQRRKAILDGLRSQGLFPPHPLEMEWEIDGDDILSSIYRASDLSRRGIRGLLAEYFFETNIIPSVLRRGWTSVQTPAGDWPYDCLLERDGKRVSIQVKLQRLERGLPKRFHARHYEQIYYDVEVQKTRTGQRRLRKQDNVQSALPDPEMVPPIATRPYPFGAFDILAVNMQPATKRWTEFRFTVGTWLLERLNAPDLIEIHQPVSLEPDEVWTDDLSTCLEWFLSGKKKKVLEQIKHPNRFRRVGDS
ncbi:hypothetical protein [Terracidiphilus sp.]|jgi:hypothetical protein|uniref:hypothetical protein n=1 Tax=Terracidiphilus sp. TaxID=1964191 RepID=UPI003C1AECAB